MRHQLLIVSAVLFYSGLAYAQRGGLILNEFNGVSATMFLENDDEVFEGRDWGGLRDLTLEAGPAKAGRIKGNGGNWLELVVVQDRLDIRGWTLNWSNADITPPGEPIPENMGTILFSDNDLWKNLRAGTIITIIEDSSFEPEFDDGTFLGHEIDLTDDVGFAPAANDWWIHVETKESEPASPYISTPNSKFKTDNDNWQLQIRNAAGDDIFGPVGEAAFNNPGDPDDGWGGSGINNQEMGILHADPSTTTSGLDFNDRDYSTFGAPNLLDPTDTAVIFGDLIPQDFSALRNWFYRTDRIPGDANLDRIVNVEDLVILAENWLASSGNDWMKADFNGDGIVNQADLGLMALNWQVAIAGVPLGQAMSEVGLIPEPMHASLLLLPALLLRRRAGRR